MESEGLKLSEKALQDYELVQKALQGDEKAFARLLSRYKDTIYFMLLKMLNNKSDAEDLTLEAFGKAFKNLHQYSPTYAFSTWLFKIASNNCIDFLRKKKGVLISIENDNEQLEFSETAKLKSKDLNPEEKSTTIKSVLEKKGFNFNYHTSMYTTKTGRVYYFCYDQGYCEVESNKYILVKNEEK